MKITWIGHACFKVEHDGYAVVFDPYEVDWVNGLKEMKETADMVLCSHEHGDHNARGQVYLDEKGDVPFEITVIPTYHDDKKGALRGENRIHIVNVDGYKLAHMGDIGCELEEAQLEQLKELDVMLVPIGGYYTINSAQAHALVEKLQPKIVIPMHYKGSGFGFDVLETVEEFTKYYDNVETCDSCTYETDAADGRKVVVLKQQNLI